jgi:hypothetical protein
MGESFCDVAENEENKVRKSLIYLVNIDFFQLASS